MWIARWLLALIVIILVLVIAWFNLDQMLTVVTFKFWHYQSDTLLIMALFVAFVLGAIAWFPVAIVQFIRNKTEMRNLRKENSRLQKELGDLRNMSIAEEESKGEENTK